VARAAPIAQKNGRGAGASVPISISFHHAVSLREIGIEIPSRQKSSFSPLARRCERALGVSFRCAYQWVAARPKTGRVTSGSTAVGFAPAQGERSLCSALLSSEPSPLALPLAPADVSHPARARVFAPHDVPTIATASGRKRGRRTRSRAGGVRCSDERCRRERFWRVPLNNSRATRFVPRRSHAIVLTGRLGRAAPTRSNAVEKPTRQPRRQCCSSLCRGPVTRVGVVGVLLFQCSNGLP